MLRNQVFQVDCNFPVHADLVKGPGPVLVHPQHFDLSNGKITFLYLKVMLRNRGQTKAGPANNYAEAAINVRNFCHEGWEIGRAHV